MAGDPSVAEVEAIGTALTDGFETYRKFVDDTMLPLIDATIQALEGDYAPKLAAWAQKFRARLAAPIAHGIVREAYGLVLLEMAKAIGRPASSVAAAAAYFHEYAVDTPFRMETRGFTFDTSVTAGGSNVGDGTSYRCTSDEDGYDLENATAEAKRLVCIGDQNQGAKKHAERFRIEGAYGSPDALDRVNEGSGRVFDGIYSRHAGLGGSGGSIFPNSSFTDFDTSADATDTAKVGSWTISSGASSITTSTTVFRDHPGIGSLTDRSLDLSGNCKLVQTLEDAGHSLVKRPYFWAIRWNRQSSGDGTLSIKMGSKSVTVSVNTGVNGTWNTLVFTPGQNSWPKNFVEDALDFEIELSSHTTGSVLVDDLNVSPFDPFDGTYWLVLGGATPWQRDDTLAYTDTGGDPNTGGENQYWIGHRANFGSFPSTASGTPPEWTDPT